MWVKASNQIVEKFPYTIRDLKKDNPNVSFPRNPKIDSVAEFGVQQVHEAPMVEVGENQVAHRKEKPDYEGNKWVLNWVVYDKSQEQIDNEIKSQADSIRNRRNEALKQCDWTVLADSPLSDEVKAEWLAYRQALRDITDLPEFPWVDLPNDPDYVEVTDDQASIEI